MNATVRQPCRTLWQAEVQGIWSRGTTIEQAYKALTAFLYHNPQWITTEQTKTL